MHQARFSSLLLVVFVLLISGTLPSLIPFQGFVRSWIPATRKPQMIGYLGNDYVYLKPMKLSDVDENQDGLSGGYNKRDSSFINVDLGFNRALSAERTARYSDAMDKSSSPSGPG